MRDFAAFVATTFGLRPNRIEFGAVYKTKYLSADTRGGPSDSAVALSRHQLGHEETDKVITGNDNGKMPVFRCAGQYTCASHSTKPLARQQRLMRETQLTYIQQGYSVAKPCRKHHLTTSHVDVCFQQRRSKNCSSTYKALIRLVLRRPQTSVKLYSLYWRLLWL